MADNFNLWIDDEREMPEGFTHHAKTSEEAIFLLDLHRSLGSVFVTASFDHDLGYDWEDRNDDSRRIAVWMSEHDYFPEVVMIHTQNPIGASWLLRHFSYDGPEEMKILRMPYRPENYL